MQGGFSIEVVPKSNPRLSFGSGLGFRFYSTSVRVIRYFAHTMPVISVIPCHFQKRFSKVKKFVNY